MIRSPRKKAALVDRLAALRDAFDKLLGQYPVHYVVAEFPEFFAADQKGHAAAATGALVKITAAVGVLLGTAPRHVECRLILPSMWKGTLPKEVTQRRLLAKYPEYTGAAEASSHEWDAWGLGDWFGTKYLWAK